MTSCLFSGTSSKKSPLRFFVELQNLYTSNLSKSILAKNSQNWKFYWGFQCIFSGRFMSRSRVDKINRLGYSSFYWTLSVPFVACLIPWSIFWGVLGCRRWFRNWCRTTWTSLSRLWLGSNLALYCCLVILFKVYYYYDQAKIWSDTAVTVWLPSTIDFVTLVGWPCRQALSTLHTISSHRAVASKNTTQQTPPSTYFHDGYHETCPLPCRTVKEPCWRPNQARNTVKCFPSSSTSFIWWKPKRTLREHAMDPRWIPLSLVQSTGLPTHEGELAIGCQATRPQRSTPR